LSLELIERVGVGGEGAAVVGELNVSAHFVQVELTGFSCGCCC
jgi:hypothetical protein